MPSWGPHFGTLTYRRSLWSSEPGGHRFTHNSEAEDYGFAQEAVRNQQASIRVLPSVRDDDLLFACVRHGSNTWEWSRAAQPLSKFSRQEASHRLLSAETLEFSQRIRDDGVLASLQAHRKKAPAPNRHPHPSVQSNFFDRLYSGQQHIGFYSPETHRASRGSYLDVTLTRSARLRRLSHEAAAYSYNGNAGLMYNFSFPDDTSSALSYALYGRLVLDEQVNCRDVRDNSTVCSGLASECFPSLTSAQLAASNYWHDTEAEAEFGTGVRCAGQWPTVWGQQWQAPQTTGAFFWDVSRVYNSSEVVTAPSNPFTGGLVGNTSLAIEDPSLSGYGGHWQYDNGVTLNEHMDLLYNTWLTVRGDLDANGFNITLEYQARLNVTGRIINVGTLTLRANSLIYASGLRCNGTASDGNQGSGSITLGFMARVFLTGELIAVPLNETVLEAYLLTSSEAYPLTPGYSIRLVMDPFAELRAASVTIGGTVRLRSHALLVVRDAAGVWGGLNIVRNLKVDAHVEIEAGPVDIGGSARIGSQCAIVCHGSTTGLRVRAETPSLSGSRLAASRVPFATTNYNDQWALHISHLVSACFLLIKVK